MKSSTWFWLGVVAVGLGLRVVTAIQLPFTNDEGAYLYDGWLVAQGVLPSGDVMVKSPVLAGMMAGTVTLTDNWLWAGRLAAIGANVGAGLVVMGVLWRGLGVAAGAIFGVGWFLLAAPSVMGVYGHTEILVMLPVAVAWSLAWLLMRSETSGSGSRRLGLAVACGVSVAVAVATRKTAVVLVPAIAGWWLWAQWPRMAWRRWLGAAGGFGLGIAAWLMVVYSWFGVGGVQEALGGGYWHIMEQAQSYDLSFYWQVEGDWLRSVVGRLFVSHIVWLGLAVVGLGWWGRSLERTERAMVAGLCGWILGLAGLYVLWPTFLPQYGSDFLLPITILGAVVWGRERYLTKRTLAAAALLVVVSVGSFWDSWRRPPLGIYPAEVVLAAAAAVRERVPESEEVLTAAVIVPYVAQRLTVLNISHPLWYRYAFIDDDKRRLFLPDRGHVIAAVERGAGRFALVDSLTRYIYAAPGFDLLGDIYGWSTVDEFAGRGRGLQLWQR